MMADANPLDPHPPALPERALTKGETKPPWRNILILGLAAAVLLLAVYWSPLRDYPARLRELSQSIRDLGIVGPVVFAGGVGLLVAVGFPRLFFCVLAGMALGFWSGLFWAQVGTLLGNYAVFLVARRGGHDWAERFLARRGKLHGLVRREGIAGVILARQLPVPGLLINLACGLFCLRHRDYLIGTIVGQLPEAVPCTLIGAGLLQASFSRSLGLISLGVMAAVLAWGGLRWFLRR